MLRHPELAAEAEEISSALLVVDDQELIDEITDRLRALRLSGPVSMLGLYECRDDTDEDMLLVRLGLAGAADDLARTVYKKVRPLHLSLPSLAEECPEWAWYEENQGP